MIKLNIKLAATAALTAALLAGCGGDSGGGGGGGVGGGGGGTAGFDANGSALPSASAIEVVTYLNSVIALGENTEPIDINSVTLATDDTSEPAPIG